MGGLFWAETARRIRARKCRTARPKLDGTQFTERFWTAICLTRTERDDGGIRRNVALVAPGRKGDGSDPGLGDTETGFLKLPLDPFGTLKPSVIGRRKLVCVAKQIQQCRIVGTGKPRRRESLRWCRLGLSSQAGFHQGWVNGRKLSRVKNGARPPPQAAGPARVASSSWRIGS